MFGVMVTTVGGLQRQSPCSLGLGK